MKNKRIANNWWQGFFGRDEKDKYISAEKFRKEYMGEFPKYTFLDWIEEFVIQLEDVEEPNHIYHEDIAEHFKKVGAYETQKLIVEKLKYAVMCEKARLERENKDHLSSNTEMVEGENNNEK